MTTPTSERSVHWVRNAAAAMGVGLVGVYAYGAAKFRRTEAVGFELPDPPAPGSSEFARLVEAMTGASLRYGNRITVLRNGCQMFPAMLEAISGAKQTIDFSSYIYWPGGITEQFTDAFVERARAGVEVNVVLDGYGSAKADRQTVERLEQAGVTVSFFRPPSWYTIHKANNRMHRRLLIVDGKVGFAGGVGIAEMWEGDAQDPEHWRETHTESRGRPCGTSWPASRRTGRRPPSACCRPRTPPTSTASTTAYEYK